MMRTTEKKRGVIAGGSGLVGGAITYYFKKHRHNDVELLAPNSKKMSIRVPQDIRNYFTEYRPDFIINSAIAAIGSDPQMALETNFLGAINLAKVALACKIPYIFISSAAVMPPGDDLREEERRPLSSAMSNYAKSKLMAELTLQHMHEEEGLDCTIIRLGIVYGKHDHKTQGFQRLLFAIARQSMPFILTSKKILHSYTHAKKIPPFLDHILRRRDEFSGETYNFADPNPVELAQLVLAIREYLLLKTPREIYLPLSVARIGKSVLDRLVEWLSRLGPEARMPSEIMFLENFYKNQGMNTEKLRRSSYGDRDRDVSVYTMLPEMIGYYLTRWEQLNLVPFYNRVHFDPGNRSAVFMNDPERLLEDIRKKSGPAGSDLQDLLW